MNTKNNSRASKALEKALTALPTGDHVLRLYVAGATDRSRQALLRVREWCEAELKGNYSLEVIDVYQQPSLAREGQIIATPTLVKEAPVPVRRLIGSMQNLSSLFPELNLNPKGKTQA